MRSEQQRANHRIYLINEIEHLIRNIRKRKPTAALRLQSLLDACFSIEDDLKYHRGLRRLYNDACKTWDSLNMDGMNDM